MSSSSGVWLYSGSPFKPFRSEKSPLKTGKNRLKFTAYRGTAVCVGCVLSVFFGVCCVLGLCVCVRAVCWCTHIDILNI